MEGEDHQTGSADDRARPTIARVHDFLLGGTENHRIDREFVAELLTAVPAFPELIRELSTIDQRMVAHLAAEGVDQFLDLGSGLPTNHPPHEVAAEAGVRPRVVYVDHDPVAVAHAQRLLDGVDGAVAVRGDVEAPETFLTEVRATLDLDRPVAVLAYGVLQYVDDATATATLRTLAGLCVVGSRLAMAHLSGRGRPEVRQWAEQEHAGLSRAPRLREPAQMEPWFDGWEVVAPGWVAASAWDPAAASGPDPATAGGAYWAVLARLR